MAKNSSDVLDDGRLGEIEKLTRKVFGQSPDRVAFPGGTHRTAFIADIGGKMYVLAKRGNKHDARLEAIVLKTLAKTGHTPEFIALQGRWLVQQCIPGPRLPVVLDQVENMEEREKLLSDALHSLVVLHNAAHEERLQHRVPKIGVVKNWLDNRIRETDTVSDLLGIAKPELNRSAIADALKASHKDFVKWDARPGNALVHNDVHYWFDWEDCGRGRALDDLTCVLSDEWSLIDAAGEDRLIEKFLSAFRRDYSEDEAYRYLMISGLVQISFRLRLAIKYKLEDNNWWSRSKCLAGDKVGVTPQEVGRLCERGTRWAKRVGLLLPYVDWIDQVSERLELPASKKSDNKQFAA